MTVLHLAAFTWNAALPDDAVTRLEEALRTFAASLPGVESYCVGRDLGLGTANADFGVVARFSDATAFQAYRDHPRHREINALFIVPNAAGRSVLQLSD